MRVVCSGSPRWLPCRPFTRRTAYQRIRNQEIVMEKVRIGIIGHGGIESGGQAMKVDGTC
jgi:hypothetical protein